MKTKLFILSFIAFSFAFGLTPKVYENRYSIIEPVRTVVYPGCENNLDNDLQLLQCMQQKLSEEFIELASDFIDLMEAEDIDRVSTKLNFTIDKQGDITEITSESASGFDELWAKEAEKILQLISDKNKLKNRRPLPAIYQDGSSTDMRIALPVIIELEDNDTEETTNIPS